MRTVPEGFLFSVNLRFRSCDGGPGRKSVAQSEKAEVDKAPSEESEREEKEEKEDGAMTIAEA